MHSLSQLKKLKEQMTEELKQTPQYRALNRMNNFIDELSQIYKGDEVVGDFKDPDLKKQMSQAIETRLARGPSDSSGPTIRPYSPSDQVA